MSIKFKAKILVSCLLIGGVFSQVSNFSSVYAGRGKKRSADFRDDKFGKRHESDDDDFSFTLDSSWGMDIKDLQLSIAVENKDYQAVVKALYEGADPNAVNFEGDTVLIAAVRNGSPLELIECLLIRGADKNRMDSRGNTPLYWAIVQGRNDVEELLSKYN